MPPVCSLPSHSRPNKHAKLNTLLFTILFSCQKKTSAVSAINTFRAISLSLPDGSYFILIRKLSSANTGITPLCSLRLTSTDFMKLCRHWWYHILSLWQRVVLPMTIKLPSRHISVFSAWRLFSAKILSKSLPIYRENQDQRFTVFFLISCFFVDRWHPKRHWSTNQATICTHFVRNWPNVLNLHLLLFYKFALFYKKKLSSFAGQERVTMRLLQRITIVCSLVTLCSLTSSNGGDPCPLGCRCTAGHKMHARHRWHRLLAAYRTHRMVYGGRGNASPVGNYKDLSSPQGRQMTCVGLQEMPENVPRGQESLHNSLRFVMNFDTNLVTMW